MLKLSKNKKYLLACSYGPDSMALFDMLLKENFDFEVAHVNYGLRKEAELESKRLKEYCNQNKINIHTKYVSDLKGKTGLEEKCRNIRYLFFKELVEKYHFDAVLVAHNQDDLIETYIMQKSRHSIVNFYGIKKSINLNGTKILRLLLKYKKEELLEYCQINNVPYMIDSSNLSNEFTRNRIRHQIVSKLSNKERKEYVRKINKENKELMILKNKLKSMPLDINTFKELDDFSLLVFLNLKLSKFLNKPLSKSYCLEIKKNFLSNKPNIIYQLNNKYFLVKEYEEIKVCKIPNFKNYEYKISSPQLLDTKYFYLDFRKDSSNRNVKIADYPIIIRNSNNNDVYQIKDYVVKVRRLFIDWKMPLLLRKCWPVIVNKDNKIVYIPHYKKDFQVFADCNFYVKEHFYLNNKK